MKRRGFLKTLLGTAAAVPLLAKELPRELEPEPEEDTDYDIEVDGCDTGYLDFSTMATVHNVPSGIVCNVSAWKKKATKQAVLNDVYNQLKNGR